LRLLTKAIHYEKIFLLKFLKLNNRTFLIKILRLASHSADGYYYPFIPVLLYFLSPDKASFFFIAALISFALELPICTIMKYGIKRNRPFEILGIAYKRSSPWDRFSLPSGHTSASSVMTVLVSYFFPVLILPAIMWSLLVGISRIYLGVHYPTDVLAGISIGIPSGLVGISMAGYFC